jgi:aminotransferase
MRSADLVVVALEEHRGATHSWLVGEPCFAPPSELVKALSRSAGTGSFRYPPHNGFPELRRSLAGLHSEETNAVAPNQIAVTSGAKGGLLALLATLLEPGDELIHPAPCYPAYPIMASRLGAIPVAVPENGRGFSGWVDAVASEIGPRTRAVVLSSPSNPTGTTLSPEAASSLVELCRHHGLRLISDEAYVDFRFADQRGGLPSDHDAKRTTVVQVRSASKSWALCGWRVGWLVADPPLIARTARTHASLVNPASGPAQTALRSLTDVPSEYSHQARQSVRRRMQDICGALRDAGTPVIEPEGGFYLWLPVTDQMERSGCESAEEWTVATAHDRGIGLWPGEDFGGEGHVRIAVTAAKESDWPAAVSSLADLFRTT